MTSRTRLIYIDKQRSSQKDLGDEGSAASGDAPPPPPDVEETEKKANDGDDVSANIAKMRSMVKPDELWLCEALNKAVQQQSYDVDSMRGVGSSQKNAAQVAMDEMEFPPERPQLMEQAMMTAFSPRVVPSGPLTVPHGTMTTPRDLKNGALTP